MPNLIVTTCGTSLLSNHAKGDAALGKSIRESANATSETATPEHKRVIEKALLQCSDELSKSKTEQARSASAELNGLLGFYGGQLAGANADVHFLLHTDTLQGKGVADALKNYLREKKLNASTQNFDNLRTDTLENFHEGLGEVIRWCHETLPGYREKQHKIIFNLTGGFKSIQGWMQTLGMFYADEIIYIFESGKELLRIPRIPINIDHAAEDAVRLHLPFFRKMAGPKATCRPAGIPGGLPETFIFRLGDECGLSPWGRLIWQQARRKLYGEALLDAPCPDIVYTEAFKKQASQRTARQFAMLNERMDDFAAYLPGTGPNPDRLNVRSLRGNPMPPSTHEFNAWAESPAWRVFFHKESEKAVLDSLAKGIGH